MPDLIEKFFDTFEIEPYKTPSREYDSCGEICSYYVEYPEITDHILIELYCNLCNAFNLLNIERHPAFVFNTKDFKIFVLKELIWVEEFFKNEYIKQQIQEVFKGE